MGSKTGSNDIKTGVKSKTHQNHTISGTGRHRGLQPTQHAKKQLNEILKYFSYESYLNYITI